MDTFAALAFATDQATEALLDRSPDRHLRAQEVENKDNGDQVHLALRSRRWLRHQDHLPLYGKISLKYMRTRLATILCSGYLVQR